MVFRRRNQSDEAVLPVAGNDEVVLIQDEHGVLVTGPAGAVSATVEWLTSIETGSVRSRTSGADLGAAVASGAALASTTREYVRFTGASQALLQEHGAVAGGNGVFRGFVRDAASGQFAGTLDWVPADLRPEQLLALQSAAVGLALRTAIAQVHDAVEQVEGKVDQIVAMLESERLGHALGDRRTLQPLVERITATGQLSETDWATVASLGPQIVRDIEGLRAHIRRQLSDVTRPFTPGARAGAVDELLGERLLNETLALLLVAEDNHRLWQEVRLANVRIREPEHLADHLADARAALDLSIVEDQGVVDALGAAAGELLPPNPIDGMALVGNRQLAHAEVRLHEVMDWFAEQRLLDVEPADFHSRPGFRDSVGYLGSRGRSAVASVPGRLLPGRSQPAALPAPDTPVPIERMFGALLGVHAGDSLGATLEFTSADEAKTRFPDGLRDIVGGGPFGWPPGAATDDTDLTLAVANAYRDASTEHDALVRAAAEHMMAWYVGVPKDIGNATREALRAFGASRDPYTSGLTAESSQGNGSLMRTIPVAVARSDADQRAGDAVAISAITHAHPVCLSACVAYCDLVHLVLVGASPAVAVEHVRRGLEASGTDADTAVVAAIDTAAAMLGGADWPAAKGWVLDSLSIAVWAILTDRTLEDALVEIVMHGGDTDTNAAIAGGLLGAHHGVDAIPDRWLDTLEHRDTLAVLADQLAIIRAGEP